MDKVREASEKAVRNIKVADHMLTQTYPSVKDPKILLAVLENVFLSLTNAIAALLYYELHFKRIPQFHDNFESKFNILKLNVAPKYNINKSYLIMISAIKNALVSHKKSPVEFSRKDAFVICSDSYETKTITADSMTQYISKTKEFVQDIQNIINSGK